MVRVELPKDNDGFLTSGKKIGTIRGEGKGRNRVNMPMKERSCRRGLLLLVCLGRLLARRLFENIIPDSDLTFRVSGREVRFGGMESESREGLFSDGDGPGETLLEGRSLADVDRMGIERDES